jgi:hypothetical protein
MEWIEIALLVLLAMVAVLLALLLFWEGGISRRKKLRAESTMIKEDVQKLRVAKVKSTPEAQQIPLFDFARDLESLRGAIAGSKICQQTLRRKYRMSVGPELFNAIISRSKLSTPVKRRLADEIVVGEVGRSILSSLSMGATVEKAAMDAGVPLMIAKGTITRLRELGYMDSSLKPTAIGRRVLG